MICLSLNILFLSLVSHSTEEFVILFGEFGDVSMALQHEILAYTVCVLHVVMCMCVLQEVLWESSSEEEREEEEEREGEGEGRRKSGVVDVEDVGDMLHKARPSRASRELQIKRRPEKREMVTPLLRKTLSKQGMQVCTFINSSTGVGSAIRPSSSDYVVIMWVHKTQCEFVPQWFDVYSRESGCLLFCINV